MQEQDYMNDVYLPMLKDVFTAVEVTKRAGGTKVQDDTTVIANMRRGSDLLASKGEDYVPFWTSLEDPRNAAVEQEVIKNFELRPNTLSVRDVRSYNVPWTMEVVSRKRSDVQHIRILCEHDVSDVVNIPYELERVDTNGIEQAGYAEHPGIDFLLFICSSSWTMRLINRVKLEQFASDMYQKGVRYPQVSRRIPKDVYGRTANGLLIPLAELEDVRGVIVETSLLYETEQE